MKASGRGVWWNVIPIDARGPACVTYIGEKTVTNSRMKALEVHIAKRAHEGCPDCMAAILECPEDDTLQEAVNSYLPEGGA
jgi:hypothetical protein